MELINRIRKSRKGFTLVEIIVVLVILAILAAFTIPAMLGFVGDAKAKAYLAEAREVYTAAQATATEYNAKTDISDGDLNTYLSSKAVSGYTAATSEIAATDAKTVKACKQMFNYLGGDLSIFTGDVPTTIATKGAITDAQSAWTVTVGAGGTAMTGKVASVVYVKGGYITTVYGDGKEPLTVKLK